MRRAIVSLLVPVVLGAPRAVAAEPGLVTGEVRLAFGLATGGGAGRASMRATPLVLSAGGAIAVRDQPRVAGYANLVVETLDRTGAGGEAGLVMLAAGRLRLRGGAIAIVRPYTLWGAAVAGGTCWPVAGVAACGELAADLFIGGTDLPARSAVAQLLLGVSVVFDAD